MVSEDPWHGHLNGELDSAAHGQLQEELSEPQLGEVAALLQGLWRVNGGQGGEREAVSVPASFYYDVLGLFVSVKSESSAHR